MKYCIVNIISGNKMMYANLNQHMGNWFLGNGWFTDVCRNHKHGLPRIIKVSQKSTRERFIDAHLFKSSRTYMSVINCPITDIRCKDVIMSENEFNLWKENRESLYREFGYNRLRKWTSKIVRAWEIYIEFKSRITSGIYR